MRQQRREKGNVEVGGKRGRAIPKKHGRRGADPRAPTNANTTIRFRDTFFPGDRRPRTVTLEVVLNMGASHAAFTQFQAV